MKNLMILFVFLFLIIPNCIIQAQWIKTNVPANLVLCMAANGTKIVAGTSGSGVFLSTNSGTDWRSVNNGLTNITVNTIIFSGTNIFSGVGGKGVFLSTNDGANWTQVNNGLNYTDIYSFAINGTDIFVGSGDGVYLSTNNGANWVQKLSIPEYYDVISLAVSGTNIFAGTGGFGVYHSSNYGSDWAQINNGLIGNDPAVFALAVSGTNIFAGAFIWGMYLSTNNGANWIHNNNNGITSTEWGIDVNCISIIDSNIFVGTDAYGGVFLSTNNGTNWAQRNYGMPSPSVQSFAICGSDIFAGTSAGIWKRPLLEFTGVSNNINTLPKNFTLSQNYPNPFNPGTVISYSLPSASNVKLTVFNTLGQKIKTLVSGYKPAGNYSINFNASDLPNGIYFYQLEAGQYSQIKKMILIK